MIAYFTAISFGLLSFCSTLFTPLLFLMRIIGYQYYIIRNDNEKTKSISKKLQLLTYNSINLFQCGSLMPSGCFVNMRCSGYYVHNMFLDTISVEIHLITTPAYFQTLFESERTAISFKTTDQSATEKPILTTDESAKTLTIYSRVGSYTNLFYSRLRIDVQDLESRGQQTEILDSIYKQFMKKRRGAFFIYGVSGAGKSTIGLLLACQLKGTYCHTFCPTDPGDTLTLLIRDTEPTDDKPTIILIEEANTMIHTIHNETFVRHKNTTTLIYNKSTYNILIFTSNEDKATIDNLDPCYLRQGRVDNYYSMLEPLDI